MAMTLLVDLVSAEADVFSGTAPMVFAAAEMGEVGLAPRQTALLTRLKPGEIRVQTQEGEEQSFFVSGGMLEVQPHIVTVLADTAIRAADRDEAQALEAKERAEKLLHDKSADIDYAKAQIELAQSIAELRAIQSLRARMN